jgi:hypothetical protein
MGQFFSPETLEQIAQVAHAANNAYRTMLGEETKPEWSEATQEHRDSMVAGVNSVLVNLDITPEKQHQNWMERKQAEGWTYGPEFNEADKTHNCLVEYDKLPEEQKVKDRIFRGVVNAFRNKPVDDATNQAENQDDASQPEDNADQKPEAISKDQPTGQADPSNEEE